MVDVAKGIKKAVVGEILPELIAYWSKHEQYIALVEQGAVALGLHDFRDELRGRDIVWFEDNSVVLSGLVKGSNRGEELDNGMAALHLAFAAIKARVWSEYVESKANWSDGPSRELLNNAWLKEHGFSVHARNVPRWPWALQPHERVQQILAMFS